MQINGGQMGSPWAIVDTEGRLYVSSSGTSTIKQEVIADPLNSYTSNLLTGGSFVGSAVSTLGIAGIQTSLKTDQNCTVYVDQSPNGSNWDISDNYTYYASLNNFGITTQAINSYQRVRVINNGSNTSFFRLQTALCPTVEAVPRSLDSDGNFKVGVKSTKDEYGFELEYTPMNEIRAITPIRLVGTTFQGTTIDPNFWSFTGSAVISGAQVLLNTSGLNSSTILTSARVSRYIGASCNRFRGVFRIPDGGANNNLRRWGAFNGSDGTFFQLSGTTFGLGTIKGKVENVINTGSFNGDQGNIFTLGSGVFTCEMYWTNSKVWYTINGNLIHTYSATYSPWSDTLHFPVRIENINAGSANVSLNCRTATISRMGPAQTTPNYFHNAGSGNSILKYGPGNLHSVNVNGAGPVNAQLTVYDSITNSGSIISIIDASKISAPVSFVYDAGVNFNNGLTLGQIGSFDIIVIYE